MRCENDRVNFSPARARERKLRRSSQNGLGAQETGADQSAVGRRVDPDDHIIALPDQVDKAVGDVDVHGDLRVAGDETGGDLAKAGPREQPGRADAQRTAQPAAAAADLLADAVQFGQKRRSAFEQESALLGQAQLPPAAFQKAGAECRLKLPDPA